MSKETTLHPTHLSLGQEDAAAIMVQETENCLTEEEVGAIGGISQEEAAVYYDSELLPYYEKACELPCKAIFISNVMYTLRTSAEVTRATEIRDAAIEALVSGLADKENIEELFKGELQTIARETSYNPSLMYSDRIHTAIEEAACPHDDADLSMMGDFHPHAEDNTLMYSDRIHTAIEEAAGPHDDADLSMMGDFHPHAEDNI